MTDFFNFILILFCLTCFSVGVFTSVKYIINKVKEFHKKATMDKKEEKECDY